MAQNNQFTHLSDLQSNYTQHKNNEATIRAAFEGDQPSVPYQNNPPFSIRKIEPKGQPIAYRQRQKITFEFPAEDLIKPSTIRLYFTARILGSVTVATRGGYTYDINTFFKNIWVRYNTTEIQTLTRYDIFSRAHSNVLGNMNTMMHFRGTLNNEQAWAPLVSTGIGFPRRSYSAVGNDAAVTDPWNVPRRFMTQLNVGMFLQDRLIPAVLMSNKLTLELEINDPEMVGMVESTTSIPVSNLELRMSNVYLEYTAYAPTEKLMKQIELNLPYKIFQFHGYDYRSMQVNTGQKTCVFKFNMNRKRVKYALALLRCEADENINFDSYATYMASNPSNVGSNERCKNTAIKSYQWRINQNAVPEKPVECFQFKTDYTPDFTTSYYKWVSPACEAYDYLERTLNTSPRKYLLGGPYNIESSFAGIDPGTSSFRVLYPTFPTANQTTLRCPVNFLMCGKFSDMMPNGEMCALNLTNRDIIELTIEFNGVDTVNNPGLVLDVFFVYESMVTFDTDSAGFCKNCTVAS